MYNIEILSTNPLLYEFISKAFIPLNKIQDDFRYHIPSDTLKNSHQIHEREDYFSQDVFTWLDQYRERAKGNRPFIILVIEGSLRSNNWSNLFGTTRAESGYAIFTIRDINQFINDKIRYIRYYLVRYAIGFIKPELRSHNDLERKVCIFHKKIRKIEIIESLNSGKICDKCMDTLRPEITIEIKKSIEKLLMVVSNQHPYALVLKGGGIKGVALAGALLELENHFSFNAYAGTSAGAIAAVLLGADYKPSELLNFLTTKDFNDFKDASFFGGLINYFKTRGWYPGDEIENWLDSLISAKFIEIIGRQVQLRDYKFHTIVYSARVQNGIISFDSKNERRDSHASFAARCSMSIPYFFSPKSVDGIPVYDGGLRANFPLKVFMETYPELPVIGLYLVSDAKNGNSVLGDISNIAIDGEEAEIVNNNLDKVIIIDPRPIKTTDFNLTENKRNFLISAGRLGALKFINRNFPDIEIDKNRIQQLENEILELKMKINK